MKVGSDHEYTLNEVENPVPEVPNKKETAPYEGTGVLGGVKVGDEITYEINYRNYKAEAADIVIKDTLDTNVEFVSADNGGTEADGVVTWTLTGVEAGKEGKVTLKVKVLAGALKSEGGKGKVVNGGNTASVKVGSDHEYTLNEVENPVPESPEKKEISPYEGNGELGAVKVGDKITYEITVKNYKGTEATIHIEDPLDEHVKYVSASEGGQHTGDKEKGGKVTWDIEKVGAGTTKTVTLTVEVLASALESNKGPGKVVNGGKDTLAWVDNDQKYELDEVLNPVPEKPTKQETKINETESVGNGEKGAVKVGDKITYKITVKNYKGTEATIHIEDPLDEHVKYVSASEGGQHTGDKEKGGKVTWDIEKVGAGTTKTVTLTVEVLASALESNKGPGKVVNGGKDTLAWVDNDQKYELDEVLNPVPEKPTKVETEPYKGTGMLGPVKVGDIINYEISYKNYKSVAADIVIKDKLDANVEYFASDPKGTYDKTNHQITWTLEKVEAGTEGSVVLQVKVKDGALISKNGPGKVSNGGDDATVQVGNDSAYTLNTVENPLPEKYETAPYKGTGKLGNVAAGKTITYEIDYFNYKDRATTVVIEDKLDPHVSFKSATPVGKYTYDKAKHTVTWTLTNAPVGKGNVSLTVTVLESSLKKKQGPGQVANKASIRVGNDDKFDTGEVINPTIDSGSPNTGDGFNTGLWMTLLILSVLGAGWFGIKAFRGKKSGHKKVSG